VESADFDLVAASLRADSSDLEVFVEALAQKLTQSFPAHVKVERKKSLLPGPKPVRRLTADLGDERLELEHVDGRVTCRRRELVRGIALRSEELELGPWIDALSRSLVAEAEHSERGRAALQQLLE
jgi:hypothetical protein